MSAIDQLAEAWLDAKVKEQESIATRRSIEDQLAHELALEQANEGTHSVKASGFKVKATVRYNRKINADLLQEIAAENGLSEHLGSLFRWKPEINSNAWKSADSTITKPLLAAITTTPGRPSFSIESIEE